MAKIASNAVYNKGAIQKTFFCVGNEEFFASDLATNFTLIEDFEKRINARKVKVIEKETVIWMYSTLKKKMGIQTQPPVLSNL